MQQFFSILSEVEARQQLFQALLEGLSSMRSLILFETVQYKDLEKIKN